MIRKTYKYRIAPTKAQQHLLDTMLEQCRWVYNEVRHEAVCVAVETA